MVDSSYMDKRVSGVVGKLMHEFRDETSFSLTLAALHSDLLELRALVGIVIVLIFTLFGFRKALNLPKF